MWALLWCQSFRASDIQCMVLVHVLLGNQGRANGNTPNLIFNTCRSTRDWCLGENILPHHLHNQDTVPFLLLALSSMKEQWKMPVKGSNCVYSPPPLSTNKSTKLESVVSSAETDVSYNGVPTSLNVAVPTEGKWWALILNRIDRLNVLL